MIRTLTRATPLLLCAAVFAVGAQAQTARPDNNTAKVVPGQIVIDEATHVVERVKQNPGVAALMDHAKAVLVVPRYGQSPAVIMDKAAQAAPGDTTHSAEVLTGHGSPGVFLMHTAGNWSSPAFFGIGTAHGSKSFSATNSRSNARESRRGMPVMMIFMTSRATDELAGTSGAGSFPGSHLDVMRYSDHPHKSLADADVVVWTPHERLGMRWIAEHKFHFDGAASNAYYMNQVTLGDILSSSVSARRATALQGALETKVASK